MQTVAWAASLGLHATLCGAAVWFGGRADNDGATDAPSREVGIVLRRPADQPTPFATESDLATPPAPPIESPTVDALADDPTATEGPPSPFSNLLAELLAEPADRGSGAPASGGAQGDETDGAGRPQLPIGQTRVRVFGVEGVGSRFVYAFDRSISMTGAPLRAAKAELIRSLEALGPTHRFHALFFNTRVAAFDLTGGRRRIAYATDENKRRAVGFVRSITADGGTDRFGALMRAVRHRPDVVFFLTDADDPMTPAELVEAIEESAGAVTIQVIEFGKGPGGGRRNFLVELAERTGGGYVYVDTDRLPR